MTNATSTVLLITEFLVISGFIYAIFSFFNILSSDWLRIVLALAIALVFGAIVYFRGKRLKNKR